MARSVRQDRDRDERTDERAEPAPQTLRPTPGIAAVMRMQSLLGNHATSRLLARAPASEAPPAADQEREQSAAHEQVMTLEGIGEYKIKSFQLSGKHGVSVIFDAGNDASQLFVAATHGKPIPTATIRAGRVVVTLTEVLISNYNVRGGGDGPLVEIELDGATMTMQ